MTTRIVPEKKKGRKPVPKDETKNQKFIRVVTPRVRTIIKTCRSIQKALRSNVYEITLEQMQHVNEAINKEVALLQIAYDSRSKSTKNEDIKIEL